MEKGSLKTTNIFHNSANTHLTYISDYLSQVEDLESNLPSGSSDFVDQNQLCGLYDGCKVSTLYSNLLEEHGLSSISNEQAIDILMNQYNSFDDNKSTTQPF
jgi:hypothetical protein